jgi:hypothetical protein
MQSLLRLAGWGIAASVAIAIAAVISHSSRGQQRLSIVAAAITGTATTKLVKAEPPGAAQMARLAATESETRLLTEMVRSLNNDKDVLLARLSALEHNLEDVTGSIRRQATAPAPPPVATAPEPDPPASQPQAEPTTPQAAPPEAPAPTAAPEAAAPTPAESPESVAGATNPADNPQPEPPRERQPPAAVDVGGATSFDGLRALWKSLTASHAVVFEGMHPVVRARETSKSRAAELRLVVGPIEDHEAASRICARLIASKRPCRPVAFEGGPLALTAPEQPPLSRSAPRRKTAAPRPPVFRDP